MKRFIFLGCILLAATAIKAQIIYIPGPDNLTIQEGINLANPGDTVLVAEGIYYERINFMGKKPLTVASEFILDNNDYHINNTILDGSHLSLSGNNSIVYFTSGEDTTSTLCGFTIKNGSGTNYILDPQGNMVRYKAGGAIFISGSGARIINNRITHNHLNYNPLTNTIDVFEGAAIATKWAENDNWVILENNIIDWNSCFAGSFKARGAGVSLCCNAKVINNSIYYNTCEGELNCRAEGGGLIIATDEEWGNGNTIMAIVENNYLSMNEVEGDYAFYGGGFFENINITFKDNLVFHNKVTSSDHGAYGGIGIINPTGCNLVSGNTFYNNYSPNNAGALNLLSNGEIMEGTAMMLENNYFLDNHAKRGGAICVTSFPVCLQNNVFTDNVADAFGGAIFAQRLTELSEVQMITSLNNSFSENSADKGGAIYSIRSNPLIVNSILSGNEANFGPEIYAAYSSDIIEIAFSNIIFEKVSGTLFDGGQNISDDPLFDDLKRLTLSAESPCLDIGTSQYICGCGNLHECPLYDIDGQARNENSIDQGAHELMITRVPLLERLDGWHCAYPNPVSRTLTFEYLLQEAGTVQLYLFDPTGRLMLQPVNEFKLKGLHRMDLDVSSWPAGIYFYEIRSGSTGLNATGKLVKTK